MELARSSAEAAPTAQRSAELASAEAAALLPEEPEVLAQDAVSVPLQEAAEWVAVAEPRQGLAASDAAQEPPQAAGVRQREAPGAAGVLLRGAAPDVRVVLPSVLPLILPSALPWAVPLVFPPEQARCPATLAPRSAARFAHARAHFRIALQ
jgi:hypothetical protein